jgi:hypothetical protein
LVNISACCFVIISFELHKQNGQDGRINTVTTIMPPAMKAAAMKAAAAAAPRTPSGIPDSIGGHTVAHLLKVAETTAKKKTANYKVLDVDAEGRIPKFDESGTFGYLLFCNTSFFVLGVLDGCKKGSPEKGIFQEE